MPETPTPRSATVAQARALRRRATLTERILWRLLRDRRLDGLKFRRQVPVGPYVLDFVCLARRLVVEADGPFHDPAHDARRDRWLAAQGFRVLRFANRDILCASAGVIDAILDAAAAPLPSPVRVPSPLAGEGGLRSRSDEGSKSLSDVEAVSPRGWSATPHPTPSGSPSPARGEGLRPRP
jgi:very-short-patch-repair endonuclease